MPKKKFDYGNEKIYIHEVEYASFSDMTFWKKYVPGGCEFIDVTICWEPGYYDEPDMTWFSVNWRKET